MLCYGTHERSSCTRQSRLPDHSSFGGCPNAHFWTSFPLGTSVVTLKGGARIWCYVGGQVVYLEQVHTSYLNQTKK